MMAHLEERRRRLLRMWWTLCIPYCLCFEAAIGILWPTPGFESHVLSIFTIVFWIALYLALTWIVGCCVYLREFGLTMPDYYRLISAFCVSALGIALALWPINPPSLYPLTHNHIIGWKK